jgi:hypothetical protein
MTENSIVTEQITETRALLAFVRMMWSLNFGQAQMILNEVFRSFPQTLQENAVTVPHFRHHSFLPRHFPTHYSLVFLLFPSI